MKPDKWYQNQLTSGKEFLREDQLGWVLLCMRLWEH